MIPIELFLVYSEVLKPLKKWLEIGYVLKEEEEVKSENEPHLMMDY